MERVLRQAVPGDVPAINELIALSARGLSAPWYTAAQIEGAVQYVYGADTALIADGTYFVVESGGAPDALPRWAGCGGWSRRRTLYGGDQMQRADDGLLDPATDAARIRAFFVHPAWARRGVARDLFRACAAAAYAAGFRALELASTLPGLPLYERLGFAALRREDTVLPNGVVFPLVHMRRSIGAGDF